MRALVSLVALLFAGCGLLPEPQLEAPPDCPFPDGTTVTRVGVSPLAGLGLMDAGMEPGPPGGTVYVTTEPVVRFVGDPLERWWCVVYLDEPGRLGDESTPSGATGPVPEGWNPPDK